VQLDPALSWIAALGTSLLFAASVVHKLRDWPRFVGALDNYRVLPAAGSGAAAWLVVALEACAAVLVAIPATRAAGALLAAGMLLAYGAAIALNLRRGRTSLDCGCVGLAQRRRIGPELVVRNAILAAIALLAAVPMAERTLLAIDGLTILAATLVLALVYLTADALAATAHFARGAR
jgi:hypothetical protein